MGHVIYLLTACGILWNIPPKLLNELIGQKHPQQINNSFPFHADGSCLSAENLPAVFLWDSQLLIQFRLKSLAGGLDLQGSCAPVSINLHLAAPWKSASRGILTGRRQTNSPCFTSIPAPSWSRGLILPGVLQDF